MSNTLWVVLGIVIVLFAIIGFEHHEVSSLDVQLATAKAQLFTCVAANQDFAKQVADQNSSIIQLQQKTKDEQAKTVAEEKIAQAAADALIAKNAQLENIKRSGDECKDTFTYIDTYFRSVH